VHYETQTAYIKARDGGQRVAFCKNFIAANSQYAKARFTAVVEDHMSDVSISVQKAIAHNVCGAPPVKLSKADWKPYALIKKMLQNEQKLARENAETNGWNVTEETAAVTEQFCAAVKTR
jgi:trimethylamine:corrinoid methyltransferase-like protein